MSRVDPKERFDFVSRELCDFQPLYLVLENKNIFFLSNTIFVDIDALEIKVKF